MTNWTRPSKIFEAKSQWSSMFVLVFISTLFSSRTREKALLILQTLFCQKYISDLVSQRYHFEGATPGFPSQRCSSFRSESLVEQLIGCLRKGNESEGKLAALVTSLLIIQLGESDDELYIQLRDVMLPVLRDEAKPAALRAKVTHLLCLSLSVSLTFLVLVRSSHWSDLFSD